MARLSKRVDDNGGSTFSPPTRLCSDATEEQWHAYHNERLALELWVEEYKEQIRKPRKERAKGMETSIPVLDPSHAITIKTKKHANQSRGNIRAEGWPELFMYAVYDCIFDGIPAKITVYTHTIYIYRTALGCFASN